jgi:hypothetical protein
MGSFIGKLIKYLLWLCLFVLLGSFLFGLLKFKGNFSQYIQYLNSISIEQIFSLKLYQEADTWEVEEEILLDEELDKELIEQEFSGILEDDYFLPEANSSDMNDGSFGFSGSLENEEVVSSGQNTSVSKEDLVNLIKSREQ